jgi:hypothetical protein
MVTVTILIFPNWHKEFHAHVDASSIELGEFLAFPGEGELDHPIEFPSWKDWPWCIPSKISDTIFWDLTSRCIHTIMCSNT